MSETPVHLRIAAFFDLDGTLVPRPSLERRFVRLLRWRGDLRFSNSMRWLGEALRLAPHGLDAMRHANKMYLRDVRVAAGTRYAVPFQETCLPFLFHRAGLERIQWHARRGHAIVLLSGTLEPLARIAAHALQKHFQTRGCDLAVRVCATCLEERDGHWTGRVLGEAMFGKAKARAAAQFAADEGLDLRRCFAYGDGTSDRWLLAAVGNPAVVNPSPRLARMARREDWPILDWEEKTSGIRPLPNRYQSAEISPAASLLEKK